MLSMIPISRIPIPSSTIAWVRNGVISDKSMPNSIPNAD